MSFIASVCPARIPIVTEIIEPLKAQAARLVPRMARHASTFRSIVARRGRIDPTELVLRVQGVRVLALMLRAARLFLRGKINPLVTMFGSKSASRGAATRILRHDRR